MPLWHQTIFQAPLPLSFLALPPFGCALIRSTLFPLPYPRLTSLPCQTMLRQPGTHSSPPTDLFSCPLPYFTHPPSFNAPTTFLPPLIHFAHLIPVWCCQTTFKQPGMHSSPLLPRSAAPLLCFTHWPLFDAPTTFPPPLIRFAHPIPIRRHQTMFKRPGTHSSSPTPSFGQPSGLFHPPAFV